MTIEFEIDGQSYRAVKLDTFAQLHLSRKISPVLPKLLPAMFKVFQSGRRGVFAELADSEEPKVDAVMIDDLATALEPVAAVLAGMSDQDAEYVYSACLAVVQRRVDNNWTPIWSKQQSVCLFDDIDLGVMTQIVARVTMDSLGGFIKGLLAKNADSPTKPALNGKA